MCGIVGVVLKGNAGFYKKQEDSFLQLLLADQLRGEDSTGIIGIEKDTTFYTAKEATAAQVFIPKWKTLPASTMMWNCGKAFIGHNRKKTMGVIADENAHPFVVDGTFAMVHNGTLYNHGKLAKDCAVDSEALAIHLCAALKAGMEDGDKNTSKFFEEALGKVEGAFALAMYDQTRNKIFLTRNKERPLAIIETDDAWYFMSESLMGAWVLARNSYTYDKLKVSAINEHEVVTFDLDKNTIGREQLNPKKPSYQSTYPTTGQTSSTPTTGTGKGNASRRLGSPASEKDFKRFKKEWLGKRITVLVDDVLEENYPDERLEWGNADKLQLFATSEVIWNMHSITIPILAKGLGIKSAEDVLGKKWVIDIEEATLSSSGCIIIEGGDPKPVVMNVLQLNGNETNKEFRSQLSKLDYEELHSMAEEIKFTGANWQINAVNAEIVWRDSMNSLGDAYERAKKRSLLLHQVKKGDKFVYQDFEGNIYYECAATTVQ
jgi:predicted glutamine amidotransferase